MSDMEDVQVVSDELTDMFLLALNDVTAPIISVFGILANVVNIIIYVKLGVRDPSNLTFLTLSFCDLCGLSIGLLFEISCFPFLNSIPDLTFEPMAVGYLAAAWPRAMFSRLTCCVTVFITVERCLCITWPLKVKGILTPTRALLILIALLLATVPINFMSLYTGALYLTHTFDPERNRSVLGLGIGGNYNEVSKVSGTTNTATFAVLFGVLITSTAVLTAELRRKSKWRAGAGGLKSAQIQDVTKRDRAVSATVAVLATVLILTYLPFTAITIADSVLDGFYTHRKYSNFYDVMFMISLTLECVNSSSSLFVYYKLSSQYRKKLRLILTCF